MSEEPDHYLEAYWKNYKSLIKKLFREFPVIKTYIDLDAMSVYLNYLKTETRYIEIEKTIEKNLMKTGWVMIKHYQSYYFGLYHTQLKKWKKIPSIIPDIPQLNNNYFKHINDTSFSLYISLVMSIGNNISTNTSYVILFSQLHIPDCDDEDDINQTQRYNIDRAKEIVKVLIEEGRSGTLTILSNYIDMSESIMNLYGIKVHKKINGRKLINMINDLTDSTDNRQ